MEEISLREILEIIWKGKRLIAAMIIVSLIIGLTVPISTNKTQAKMVLTFDFPGIEKGLNPDGTTFDINVIKAPLMYNKINDDLKLSEKGISSNTIQRNIVIEPIVPTSEADKEAAAIKSGKEYYYYSNSYVISLNVANGISSTMAKEILNSIIAKYDEYFSQKYSERDIVANIAGTLEFDKYDYPEISDIISTQISNINSYLANKINEAGAFRSSTSGLTFTDISQNFLLMKSVDLIKLSSLISTNNLSRNKEKAITTFDYKVKMLELEKAKKDAEAKVALDTMAKYVREQNFIYLPGIGTENIKAQQNESYYDDLAKIAAGAGVEAGKLQQDIDFYKGEGDRLKNDKVASEVKVNAEKDVQLALNDMKSKLEKQIEILNETSSDYYEFKMNQAVKNTSGVSLVSSSKKLQYLAISLLLGLMLGVFVVLFKEYWKNSGKKAEKV